MIQLYLTVLYITQGLTIYVLACCEPLSTTDMQVPHGPHNSMNLSYSWLSILAGIPVIELVSNCNNTSVELKK